jgi:hypothetical protein
MLIKLIICVCIVACFALCYRSRGSHHDNYGTTFSRLINWVAPNFVFWFGLCNLAHFPFWVAVMCAATCWAGICVGHGSAQGNSTEQYEEMGFITMFRLWGIMLPFMVADYYLAHSPHKLLPFFPMFALPLTYWACKIGYTMKRSFNFLGVKCVPGDSSWEEFYIGALAYGLQYACIFYLFTN